MKLIVHDYAGHPFQIQLSRALAARGHEVHHLYAASVLTPRGRLSLSDSDPSSLSITPIALSKPYAKYSFWKRWRQEREYGHLVAGYVRNTKPDCVLSANTPSESQRILQNTCRANHIRFVSWLQDLYGVAATRLLRKKIPVAGALIGRYFTLLDRASLRRSNHVVAISEDFVRYLWMSGLPNTPTTVIRNWAPLEEMPLHPKDNAWARSQGLDHKFCFMYSGTLGMKHNPGLLLSLATDFRDNPDVRVVVLSEGLAADWLRNRALEATLNNLVVLPFQPFERLPEVLAAADVLVAILELEAAEFSVPSKILSYLCAKRPILAAIPEANLAARTLRDADAGMVVQPDETLKFIAAARKLHRDDELRSRTAANARRFAEREFDIEKIADAFEHVLNASRPTPERLGASC